MSPPLLFVCREARISQCAANNSAQIGALKNKRKTSVWNCLPQVRNEEATILGIRRGHYSLMLIFYGSNFALFSAGLATHKATCPNYVFGIRLSVTHILLVWVKNGPVIILFAYWSPYLISLFFMLHSFFI